MRTLLILCSLAIAYCHAAPVSADPPLDFTVESPTHNRTFRLADASDKIVVLHFLLKTECPYCLRHLQAYAHKSASREDVVHVFLKPDSEAEIKRWAANLDTDALPDSPVIYRDPDAKLAKAFKIPGGYQFHGQSVHYPALIALDESGKELFRYVGKNNTDRLSYSDFEKRLAAARSKPNDLVPRRLLPLVHAAEVQRELSLSEEQVEELEKCFARLDGPWFRSRILPPEKQSAELKDLEAEFWKWASSILKTEQLKRLRQLESQAIGSRLLLREEIARQLKFTSTQNEKFLQLVRETESAQKKYEAAEQRRQPATDLQKSLMQATEAEQRGLLEILTEPQKQQITQMIGARFDTTQLKRIYPMAPELAPGTEWFNSQPLTLHSLRGKVVLVHFYAFECHNCHANFAIYQRWHQQWKDKGVVVIGIQSPETDRERDPQAVRQAAADRGLEFPIIMDRQMQNWNNWANTMWPSVYVIDKRGYLRHWWQGELNWQGATGDKTIESIVETALTE